MHFISWDTILESFMMKILNGVNLMSNWEISMNKEREKEERVWNQHKKELMMESEIDNNKLF